jgi:hypothetical protein
MIICYFDIDGPCLCPSKADAILVIDPDTVLALTLARQSLQTVTRWNAKFFKKQDRIKLVEFSLGNFP